MAKTVTLKTGVTVEWGIPTAHLQSDLGIVKSVKINNGSKEKEYADETGECAAFLQYDKKDTLTVEVIAKTSATIPAIGAVFTHATVKYLILTVDKNWQNEDVQQFTLNCRTFANITLT
jgi:hypothetical protein